MHVNATDVGGGVAELLHGLVRAQSRKGLPVGWAVIAGDRPFFETTKNLYHCLLGNGSAALLADQRRQHLYRSWLHPQAEALSRCLEPGETVILHDTQTLGMAPVLAQAGIRVAWHCHVGSTDGQAPLRDAVWEFFGEELRHVHDVFVAQPDFAPDGARIHAVPPAIDFDTAKNRPLADEQIEQLLTKMGLYNTNRLGEQCTVHQTKHLPRRASTVLQLGRWDPVKDMVGVLRSFRHVAGHAHLILAGPDPTEIPDDPEGVAELEAMRRALDDLPTDVRARVHLVVLSARDATLNALFVNALQTRADVVLQKSLQEGFGLTVTEAMYKGRAVVASDVGGLRLQVQHEANGLLVPPHDGRAAAEAVNRLLRDRRLRLALGARAARSARERYGMPRLVADYLRVLGRWSPQTKVVTARS